MIESREITISMTLSYYSIENVLYGKAYFLWKHADRDKRLETWDRVVRLAEETEEIPDLDTICELIESQNCEGVKP